MADRGMGIRLFESKDALRRTLESFEDVDSDSDHDEDAPDGAGIDTSIVMSQLRHFVIQVCTHML